MPSQASDIKFPLGGVDKLLAFQSQEPYTCVDAMNVWPRDSIAGRMRGGSRPGLRKVFSEQLGGPIHLLSQVRVIEGTEASAITHFADNFSSPLVLPRWTGESSFFPLASHINRTDEFMAGEFLSGDNTGSSVWFSESGPCSLRTITETALPDGEEPTSRASQAGVVLRDLNQETTEDYTISLEVGQSKTWNGSLLSTDKATGVYVVHLQMKHDDIPLPWVDSLTIFLAYQVASSGFAAVTAVDYSGANATTKASSGYVRISPTILPTIKIVVSSSGTQVDVTTWGEDGPSISFTPGAAAGRRIGFGMYDSVPSPRVILHKIESFKVAYVGSTRVANRNIVVAVGGANGASDSKIDIRFEDVPDTLSAPASKLEDDNATKITNALGAELVADESLGQLFIAGESDQAGTAKEIWVFDPTLSSSLGLLTDIGHTSLGTIAGDPPTDTLLCTVWRNRVLVVERADPHNISMGKVGIPLNWSYATIPIGTATQLSTTGIDAGRISEPINALIAHSDDYLIIGCANSLYLLTGDPTLSGQIARLSSSIGIVAPQAWARGPDGETVFLSNDGIYGLAAGPNSYPQSVSREKLPQELRDIDVVNNRVLMEYDVRNRGVFIGITPLVGGGGNYFWFDWEFRGFWPMSFHSAHEPMSLVYRKADASEDQRIMLGCRDGYIRSFFDNATSDDGLPLESYVLIGPIMLGGGGYYDGMLREVIGQLGGLSGEVKMEVLVGRSAEEALAAKPVSPLRLTAGKNKTIRPCRRGNAAFIKLSSSDRWALENLTIVKERLGKQRL